MVSATLTALHHDVITVSIVDWRESYDTTRDAHRVRVSLWYRSARPRDVSGDADGHRGGVQSVIRLSALAVHVRTAGLCTECSAREWSRQQPMAATQKRTSEICPVPLCGATI
jgi:hypothetical protein